MINKSKEQIVTFVTCSTKLEFYYEEISGPALMAVCSKVLPLTDSYSSPLSGFEPRLGRLRKVPVTWGWAVVFARCPGFLQQLQLASPQYGEKSDENQSSKVIGVAYYHNGEQMITSIQ